ncbi:hypothetical protein COY26_04770 [Candidatus Woesearchaeota archaeon CG_4_10_14_0_2_um_filter_33_10]|nr:MAG: hypothetical protein COV14_01625 [Candidatus Woesearchaeota archaeon CG10_big_fil_rev_8_21_14_0_10_33_12]PIZ52342.1 MAG: hypothetical protein COY26_04770 [Candidatus Woesearchaeota archaeon CG_4_10_14_0_2_um_filter_33_10]
MMKTKTLQIIVLILLINMLFVRASIDASYECREKNCMEGTEIDFTVNIYNNINKSINVGDVYIKDNDYSVILGFDLSEKIVLNPDEVRSFNFTSLIKAPTKGYTFYYVPCFKMSYANKPEEVFEICGNTVKSFTVIPLSEIECKEDSECEEDEYCNTFSIYKCRKLECKSNEAAVNHSCALLEPKKIVVINWWNIILTVGFIILAVVLLFLFVGRKQKYEEEDYVDMTTEFNEKEESPKKEKTDKKKEEQKEEELENDNKKTEENKDIKEFTKEPKQKKPKKDEENKEIKDSVKEIKEKNEPKKGIGGDEEIKKKTKPKNKKKYKRVKLNKTYEEVPDYIVDEQKEKTKKKQEQEIEDDKIEIMDYSGYEDEDDDEENRDIL